MMWGMRSDKQAPGEIQVRCLESLGSFEGAAGRAMTDSSACKRACGDLIIEWQAGTQIIEISGIDSYGNFWCGWSIKHYSEYGLSFDLSRGMV